MPRLKRLVVEIHRHSLWQIVGIYVGAAWLAQAALFATAESLTAQEKPVPAAQEGPVRRALPPWYVKGEFGRADIHAQKAEGSWLAIRLGRRLDSSGYAWLDLGFTTSSADGGFGTLELGVELQLFPLSVVTPLLGFGAGIFGESDFSGGMVRFTLGVDARLQRHISVRAGIQRGWHGGAPGPNVIFGGIELRIGR